MRESIIENLFALFGYKVLFIVGNIVGTLKVNTLEYIFFDISKGVRETERYTSKNKARFAYYLLRGDFDAVKRTKDDIKG